MVSSAGGTRPRVSEPSFNVWTWFHLSEVHLSVGQMSEYNLSTCLTGAQSRPAAVCWWKPAAALSVAKLTGLQ